MTDSAGAGLAVVFPGQGSQAVGMMADFADSQIVQSCFAAASDTLGIDLWRLVAEGPEEKLNQTQYTQPAILVASVSLWRLWLERGGVQAVVGMAGHSLGEYSALVAAEALELIDAVYLVHRRGRLMQEAVAEGAGAMAAVLGLDDDQVIACCAQTGTEGLVSCANFNAPGQVVIAGNTQAVEAAGILCREAGAKKVIPLPVSVPSHCALMQPAASHFEEDLARINFKVPGLPVFHNADIEASADAEQIKARLLSQLTLPVRWTQMILKLQQQGADSLIECGPGSVLTAMTKRIDRNLVLLNLGKVAGLESALQQTKRKTKIS